MLALSLLFRDPPIGTHGRRAFRDSGLRTHRTRWRYVRRSGTAYQFYNDACVMYRQVVFCSRFVFCSLLVFGSRFLFERERASYRVRTHAAHRQRLQDQLPSR